MPKIGRPLGPGIGISPIWFLPFLHANPPPPPPFGIAHVRNAMERSASRIIRSGLSKLLFCVPAMAGSVNTHQLVSSDVEAKPILLDARKLMKAENEGDRTRE